MTMTMEQSNTAFIARDRQLLWPKPDIMTVPLPVLKVQVVGSELPTWLSPIVERLSDMGGLSPGWGGPATIPPTPVAVFACLSGLQAFMPHAVVVPAILPTASGGIQLEWHCGGWDLEVEFDPNGLGEFWGEDHTKGQQISGSIDFPEDLTLALKALSEREGG